MKRFLMLIILIAVVLSGGYGVFIYYDNNFPFGRMRETPVVKPHEQPIPMMEAGVVPTNGGEWVNRFDGLESPLDPTAGETLKAGMQAYADYCVFCHGMYFDGAGTVGQSFHPLPIDLKSPAVQDKDDRSLFTAVSYGLNRMPSLATTMTVGDRWAVIHYLRSLSDASQTPSRS